MINKYNVKKVCCEDISLIENYELAMNDNTQIWCCHHRLEIDESKSKQQLIDEGRYYNRPAYELIFLTKSEHISLHNKNIRQETRDKLSAALTGRIFTEETKQKMSDSAKKKKLSEEHKQKISDWQKVNCPFRGRHHSEEAKQKLSESHKGKTPWNKGKKCPQLAGENNPMYGKSAMKGRHHSEESKQKMGIAQKQYNKEHPEVIEARVKSVRNTKFVHNSIVCKRIPLDKVEEYLNNGYVLGMLNTGK